MQLVGTLQPPNKIACHKLHTSHPQYIAGVTNQFGLDVIILISAVFSALFATQQKARKNDDKEKSFWCTAWKHKN